MANSAPMDSGAMSNCASRDPNADLQDFNDDADDDSRDEVEVSLMLVLEPDEDPENLHAIAYVEALKDLAKARYVTPSSSSVF